MKHRIDEKRRIKKKMERKAIVGIVLSLLLITMITYTYNLASATLGEAWWNASWGYRAPITITENSGSDLTDYQALVTVDTASLISQGKMRSDCGDIRFTDSDSNEVPYWIESGINSANTKIWVKVPIIPASGTAIIYMYYGNPTASSISNGDAVFDFFDDFLGTELDSGKWTWRTAWGSYLSNDLQPGTGYVTVANSTVSVVAPKNNQPYPWEIQMTELTSLSNFTLPLVLEGNLSIPNWGGYGSAGWYRAAWGGLSDFNITLPGPYVWRNGVVIQASEGSYSPYVFNESAGTYLSDFPGTPVDFHTYRVLWKTNSVKFYRDGVYHEELTTNVPNVSLPIWFLTSNWAGTRYYPDSRIDVDWVRIRKYAFPEPTVIIGVEEFVPSLIPATIDIDPDTLNLRSRGKWITCYIELPEDYNVRDIDVSTIKLNDTICAQPRPIAIGDYDNDTIPDLMVKFNRTEVISYILANVDITERFMTITLTVTGKLNDGTPFQGSDTIRIILPTPRERTAGCRARLI